jgi:hypothetical protein
MSAIQKYFSHPRYRMLHFLVAIVVPCTALQRGNWMAIQTAYDRQKIEGTGWRYRPLTVGRRPEAAKNGPYFIRVRDSAGKYQWVKYDTEQATAKAAKAAPVARRAQELGLTVDDLTNEANTNRISIKTAVANYLEDRRFGRPRSIAAYENAFDQLLVTWVQTNPISQPLAVMQTLSLAVVQKLGLASPT